jgi:hypothetical protein
MSDFKKIDYAEMREELALLLLTTFRFSSADESSDKLVGSFLHSEHFLQTQSIGSFGVTQTWETYTLGAFNLENVSINDFRKLDKEGMFEFLIEYGNDPSWKDDKASFQGLLNYFLSLNENTSGQEFYLINKSWFEKAGNRLVEFSDIYTFFLLVICVNLREKTITVSEWFYD